ncbi:Uracil phosphoribosyltransferase [Ephemeroptericola cinctiostellae]|uniref:Uracil phosphoribosyltransferase n=1 Tax=Ephemeroptericola cinctiostellae TaxID=2268024 RepID=A0A345DCD2_9BURK|nr:uracil phosphoribosyltransferase [Ephemeroptericola cinctiostellae]AXF86020.1 Uracil phosphoribosyltransferase [Ephemeroptericola cinctiostellae]
MTQHVDFPNLYVVNHPLVAHKLSYMRSIDTSTRSFRALLRELTLLMGYELTRDLPLTTINMKTPLCEFEAPVIAGKKIAVVPVLRAGLGMADGLLDLIPSARQGHIGLYRDEENFPVEYYVRLPKAEGRLFILCDPMLATGHSAVHAAHVLLKHGVDAKHIRFLALVAAPEGIKAFHATHPDIKVFVAALDKGLNEHAYIVPGLGDAGDRIFGTKS